MPRRRPLFGLAVALAAVALTGCRIDVAATARVDADGTGRAGWTITLDDEARAAADAGQLELVPSSSGVDDAGPWRVDDTVAADGSRVIAVSRTTTDFADLAAAFTELTAALAADDPALRVALTGATRDGATTIDGTATFMIGEDGGIAIDGVPVGPTGSAFVARIAESVEATFQLTVDGHVVSHDADRVDAAPDGTRLYWTLAPREPRAVHVTFRGGSPTPTGALVLVAAGVAGVLALAGFVVAGRWTRRRAARDAEAVSRAE